jgi:hypothetical protein
VEQGGHAAAAPGGPSSSLGAMMVVARTRPQIVRIVATNVPRPNRPDIRSPFRSEMSTCRNSAKSVITAPTTLLNIVTDWYQGFESFIVFLG